LMFFLSFNHFLSFTSLPSIRSPPKASHYGGLIRPTSLFLLRSKELGFIEHSTISPR